jgi:hypothetical protein
VEQVLLGEKEVGEAEAEEEEERVPQEFRVKFVCGEEKRLMQVREHTSAYVSIRQHASAYVC